MPMVEQKLEENKSSVNRVRKAVFPTAELPMIKILKRLSWFRHSVKESASVFVVIDWKVNENLRGVFQRIQRSVHYQFISELTFKLFY